MTGDGLTVRFHDPASNGNGGYHVRTCPDHPDADIIERSRTYLNDCGHSWTCRCPSLEVVYGCVKCDRSSTERH